MLSRKRKAVTYITISTLILSVFSFALIAGGLSSSVYADEHDRPELCDQLEDPSSLPECTGNRSTSTGNTGSNDDPFQTQADIDGDCEPAQGEALSADNCEIIRYVLIITNALSVLVGIVVVLMIVIGGIQYSTSGSNPQAVAAAKKRIGQALLALVVYFLLFAFLQWIVPGGVFSS